MEKVSMVTLTGASQLAWSEDPAALAPQILNDYYGSSNPDLPVFRAGHDGDRPIDADLLETLGSDRYVTEKFHRSPVGAGA